MLTEQDAMMIDALRQTSTDIAFGRLLDLLIVINDATPRQRERARHATNELLDDLLYRGSVRSQMPEAIAAARTLGAPARARRLEEIHSQDLEAEHLLALDLMQM